MPRYTRPPSFPTDRVRFEMSFSAEELAAPRGIDERLRWLAIATLDAVVWNLSREEPQFVYLVSRANLSPGVED